MSDTMANSSTKTTGGRRWYHVRCMNCGSKWKEPESIHEKKIGCARCQSEWNDVAIRKVTTGGGA